MTFLFSFFSLVRTVWNKNLICYISTLVLYEIAFAALIPRLNQKLQEHFFTAYTGQIHINIFFSYLDLKYHVHLTLFSGTKVSHVTVLIKCTHKMRSMFFIQNVLLLCGFPIHFWDHNNLLRLFFN